MENLNEYQEDALARLEMTLNELFEHCLSEGVSMKDIKTTLRHVTNQYEGAIAAYGSEADLRSALNAPKTSGPVYQYEEPYHVMCMDCQDSYDANSKDEHVCNS